MTSCAPSRSEAWDNIRTLEDALAILNDAEQLRIQIRRHAWREGSWDAVNELAKDQADALAALKAVLSARWYELYGEVKA